MSALAELQEQIARALLDGGEGAVAMALVGGARPPGRLRIHQRHFEASLTAALVEKFPACAWLVGTQWLTHAARAYVHAYPPERPCIAEYGSTFPCFLATCRSTEAAPYLESFATLEWAVGQVSIAIERPSLAWSALAGLGSERLLDCALTLQPGLRYLDLGWRVDELMTLYLADQRRERFVLAEADTYIELRGARGTLSFGRLDSSAFEFRRSLVRGRTVGDAAGEALERDAGFDVGGALQTIVAANLVTQVVDRLEVEA